MKAIIQTAYGSPDAFELKDIAQPVVKDNEALVRVHAASLHAGDVFLMRGKPYMSRLTVGFPKPKNWIPGLDVAGQIEAVGRNVTRLRPGDAVFGGCSAACAEYVSAKEDMFVEKPRNLTLEQAAAVPTSALAALHGLRDQGKVQPGQKILINGASGGVGTFAVQIAKALGAEVTAVCSTRHVELVRSLGADHVIDYTQEDFTKNAQRYDVILDNVGSRAFRDYWRVLTPQGMHIPSSGHGGMSYILKALLLSKFVRQQRPPFLSTPNRADLVILKELIEAGKVAPVIDRTYPLNEISEAFRYLDQGHARGKVVITMEHNVS